MFMWDNNGIMSPKLLFFCWMYCDSRPGLLLISTGGGQILAPFIGIKYSIQNVDLWSSLFMLSSFLCCEQMKLMFNDLHRMVCYTRMGFNQLGLSKNMEKVENMEQCSLGSWGPLCPMIVHPIFDCLKKIRTPWYLCHWIPKKLNVC